MNDKLITRFSIWDKNETVLFDSYDYKETLNEIGEFPAPLRRIGDEINVNGEQKKITNIFFGMSENNTLQNNMQIIIEVE